MRTTLILNDHLALEAKKLAARERSSLSKIVNEGLRLRLQEQTSGSISDHFSIPTFRGRGPSVDTLPSELAEIGEEGIWRVAEE